ncbi:MAG: iron ABC transporter permease [Methylococcaceae bacterium]|nr:MAG: iron ABC transporter permease [Methylococcaceae bacterium]
MSTTLIPRRIPWFSLAALLLAMLPLLAVLATLLTAGAASDAVVRAHLAGLLPGLLLNTVLLAAGVGLGALTLGAGLAWLISQCDFPGRRWFDWAMVLPLAMPAYVLGFVLIGLLDYSGPLQTALRDAGLDPAWFPAIRSGGGAALALTLSLYPYVYLLARNAFQTQGRRLLEAARSLGDSRRAAFFRVLLPMARPWLGAGVLLVLMETLADFGTVAVFNYDTFTNAIYKAWYGLFSLGAAGELSACLVLLALLLLVLEQRQRARQRYAFNARGRAVQELMVLRGAGAWLACGVCLAVLAAGFFIPLGQLLLWTWQVAAEDLDQRYVDYLLNSLALAGIGAALTVAVSLLLAVARRRSRGLAITWAVRFATLGYAVPGTVLAVGLVTPLAWLEGRVAELTQAWLGWQPDGLLGNSLGVLVLAYLVRFAAVSYGAVDSALERITPSMAEASRSLGVSGFAMVYRLHLPLLRGGLFSGALLVFVDIMKEMPITLMIRPFGWDNLAVRIFEMVSEGQWQRAALPSVVLVALGLVPVIMMVRASEQKTW